MQIDPNLIVSPDEFNELMGIEDGIPLGVVTEHSPDSFGRLMEVWVTRIEQKMSLVAKGSVLYKNLKNERGITFDEYRAIFNNLSEEAFDLSHLYPALDVLMIPDMDFLHAFLGHYENNGNGYLKALRYIAGQREMAGLSLFFSKIGYEIPVRELKLHAYISGSTGSGKSQLIRLLFYWLQKMSNPKNSMSLVLIDPHGDISEEIKTSHLNAEYPERFILVDPELQDGHTPVINPLEIEWKTENDIVLHAQSIADAIENMLSDRVSDVMSTILIPCLSLLIRKEGTTLLDLVKLMNNNAPELVEEGLRLPNEAHREIFIDFHKRHKGSKEAILKRISKGIQFPAFGNLVNGKSTINLEEELNSGKIIVFNLSQRYFGSAGSSGFGRFIVALIKTIALSRSKDRRKRMDTFLFIDECQRFLSPSIEMVLEEGRKFRLYLVLANQSVERLGDVMDVVLANTSVKLIGSNASIKSLKILSASTGTSLEELTALKDYKFYVKTRDRAGRTFKPYDILIKDKSYTMSKEQEKELDDYLLKKYYIDTTTKSVEPDEESKKRKFKL